VHRRRLRAAAASPVGYRSQLRSQGARGAIRPQLDCGAGRANPLRGLRYWHAFLSHQLEGGALVGGQPEEGALQQPGDFDRLHDGFGCGVASVALGVEGYVFDTSKARSIDEEPTRDGEYPGHDVGLPRKA
jgi:hypothetical protein